MATDFFKTAVGVIAGAQLLDDTRRTRESQERVEKLARYAAEDERSKRREIEARNNPSSDRDSRLGTYEEHKEQERLCEIQHAILIIKLARREAVITFLKYLMGFSILGCIHFRSTLIPLALSGWAWIVPLFFHYVEISLPYLEVAVHYSIIGISWIFSQLIALVSWILQFK